jgi:hypothetical protein
MDIVEFYHYDQGTRWLREFKAPKGYIYEINNICITLIVNETGHYVAILDDAKIDYTEDTFPLPLYIAERCIVLLPTVSDQGEHNFDFPIPHKTKYITMIIYAPVAAIIHIRINIDLVKATQDELIYEFVKKTNR